MTRPIWLLPLLLVLAAAVAAVTEASPVATLMDASPVATLMEASPGAGRRRRVLDGNGRHAPAPEDIAWQAWLLVDSGSTSVHDIDLSLADSTAARRIRPKSVFIAPAFSPQSLPACADGYRSDPLGRCVKLVRVNQAAQLDFLLQRLNSMHSPMAAAASSTGQRDDENPMRVRLSVTTKEQTSTKAPITEPPPSEVPLKSPPRDAEEVASPDSTHEPIRVSVVMADVSKRNSVDSSSQSPVNDTTPVITVWTLENDTHHTALNTDNEDSFSVELPTTSQLPKPTDVPADASKNVLTEVLAPTDVKDSLPMLVISTESSPPATTVPSDVIVDSLEENIPEGSGEEVEALPIEKETEHVPHLRDDLDLIEADEEISVSRTEHDAKIDSKGLEEIAGSGSIDDLTEHVKVVPISEHMRHQLPLLEETEGQNPSFSSTGHHNMDFLSMAHDTRYPAARETQHPGYVRFPSSSETTSVNLYKGNTVKFPTDYSHNYKHRHLTETQPDRKQVYWWLPPGWRVENQRRQPSVVRLWSRMPLTTDQSLLRQYSPPYNPPLPYWQRQENYNSQWSSMRRHMTT